MKVQYLWRNLFYSKTTIWTLIKIYGKNVISAFTVIPMLIKKKSGFRYANVVRRATTTIQEIILKISKKFLLGYLKCPSWVFCEQFAVFFKLKMFFFTYFQREKLKRPVKSLKNLKTTSFCYFWIRWRIIVFHPLFTD